MSEQLQGPVDVRETRGEPAALRTPDGWRDVGEVALTWRVETDWWRLPVSRDYFRCLLDGGECVDVYRDSITGAWHWVRRHD